MNLDSFFDTILTYYARINYNEYYQ